MSKSNKYAKKPILRSIFGPSLSKKMSLMGVDFPIQIPEVSFVQQTYKLLEPLGFNRFNVMPCVSLCRDELTVAMLNLIDDIWSFGPEDSQSFLMHSLGGMLFLGKTGLLAAMHHAPHDEKDGKERYVFYCFSHIGYNDQGIAGKVRRHGIKEESGACGALIAFLQELESGFVNFETDPDDIEQSLLKQRLVKKIKFGKAIPSLAGLTKLAHEVSLQDLERLISLTIDTEEKKKVCDYAVFTGVQINGGERDNYVWPGSCYYVVDGKKTVFNTEDWDTTPISENEEELKKTIPAADATTTSVATGANPTTENPLPSNNNQNPSMNTK